MRYHSKLATENLYTIDGGRLVPTDGEHIRKGVSGAMALGNRGARFGHPVSDASPYTHDTIRKGQIKPTALDVANTHAWDEVRDAAAIKLATDAFTVAPAGAPFLDLIGRLAEVALMPRPPMLFERAFPDTIPFDVGRETVTADLAMWTGRPMLGWRNSLDDIPEFDLGFVTTQLHTAWIILNVPITMQDAARSALSGATVGTVDRLSLALDETARAIDYVRWFGNTPTQIQGILSHPFLSRFEDANITIPSGLGTGSGSTSQAIYASFIYIATFAKSFTRGSGKVDTVVFSYQILSALESQFIVISGTPTQTTLLAAITDAYGRLGIKILPSDDPYWPLDDVGGTGIHGVLFYSREPQRCPAALQGMSLTAYPDQSHPLVQNTYLVACIGDVHLRQAQSTVLALYQVS